MLLLIQKHTEVLQTKPIIHVKTVGAGRGEGKKTLFNWMHTASKQLLYHYFILIVRLGKWM